MKRSSTSLPIDCDQTRGVGASPGRGWNTTLTWAAVIVGVVALVAVGGCQSAPEPVPSEIDLSGKSDPEILYQAALLTFRESSMTVDLASEETLFISTEFESVPKKKRVRRRISARIIRVSKGAAALRLKTEFQRKFGSGEAARWKTIDSEPLKERARERELELGRKIERRFHDWREQVNDDEAE